MRKYEILDRKSNMYPSLWAWALIVGFVERAPRVVFKGRDWGNILGLFREGTTCWVTKDKERVNALMEGIKEDLLKDPDYIKSVREIFDKKSKPFLEFVGFCKSADFSKYPEKDIFEFYNKFLRDYTDLCAYGEPIAWLSREAFADFIEEDFINKKKGSKEEFEILISATEKPFIQREEEGLLNLALKGGDIKKHTEEFEWMPYDYGAYFYDENHFSNELKKLSKKNKNELEERYYDLINYELNLEKKQKSLFKRYKISGKEEKYFEVLQIGSYLVDKKKEVLTKAHFYGDRLLKEIGKRINLDWSLMRYVLPFEIKNLLIKKEKPDILKLERRKKNVVWIAKPDGDVEIIEENKAKKILDEFFEEERNTEDVDSLNGRGAYKGVVQGRARVILDSRECSKFKDGEILVTVITSPDFIVAVRKARGIVTDQGGATCHAAIIARELKIPTVIGTKIATKVFKTGDYINVDADCGIVRIIKD
ncbi:MAG: PEP-utilizing enzyme [Candidatus Nanoarchaeia archaeon]|nr:PEP-utilizing enzyme [Candidatus Nanoarchaeia archaeon]